MAGLGYLLLRESACCKCVMRPLELSLIQIGNSRGIRLPAELIRKHGFEHGLVLKDRGYELALRPKTSPKKLSWEETARETVAANEDWSDWDCTLADGLDDVPWEGPIPAEVRKWAKECAAKERQQMQRHTKAGRRKG
jgi:antitoxin component of MazEF toxin-antitoxin module